MSFNMSALRASVGSIAVTRPLMTVQRPVAASCMPAFTGLSISGRLSMQSEGNTSFILCHLLHQVSAFPGERHRVNPRSPVLSYFEQ